MFWLAVVGVVAFSWGFAAGATHEQYKPLVGKRKAGGFRKGAQRSNLKHHSHMPPIPMPPPPPIRKVEVAARKAMENVWTQ